MVSCSVCSHWQHIECHDKVDAQAGRQRRNWTDLQFSCSRCLNRRPTMHPYTGTSGPGAGQWQNDTIHLHPPTSHWGASNPSGSQHHSTLPTSDLRGSYPPSNHLTSHTSHSGVSYQTIPLSQSPYAGLSGSRPGSSNFASSYAPANHIPYGSPTNGAYSRQSYTGGSQYPVSDHRTHSQSHEVC